MMKKLIPILTVILLAFGSNGQAPAPYPILVDSQRDTVAGLQVFQANQITFRASYRSGNATNNLVAVTPFMYWQPYGPTNATVVTGRWTIVSAPGGTVDFAFTPADLNFATGTYTYQIGLNVSGGPNVIKQGSFIIKASQASIGASPIAFATTNVNWGAINWSGLPAYEYQTNTIAISNALNGHIVAVSNSLNSQISSVSNSLNTSIVNTSNALNTRVTATETGKVAKAGDTISGNLGFTNAGLTSLDFATFDTAPTGAISQSSMQWQSGRQTLRLGLNANVSLDVGQQVILYARNDETNTLSKGEVVFVAGANGDNPTIKRASNASEALSARTIGITAEDITVNASGHVVTKGTVYGLNTTNFTQGANLYLGANGMVQTNLPAAPLHGVFVGVVERVHQNAGQIYVAIQNYQELRELSDVFVNGVANNDLIVYNAASSRWQNATLASLGITTGGGITVESDPIFVAASNSFYPRSNPSNFITTAALSGYATGTPIYAETDPTALTNVTASGRITATPSGKQVALTFDASGLATGTPIYSVSGLATGTPLYAFTETDTIATNRLTNYYTITSADAKFATGTPLYVESAFNANSNRITVLEGYTNRAASALASSVWASAESTTNAASRLAFASFTSTYATANSTTNSTPLTTFSAATNALSNRFTNYLPLTGGAMSGNINMQDADIEDILYLTYAGDPRISIEGRNFFGAWNFVSQPTIPGYLTTSTFYQADSTTNYASRITFNSTSNGFNTRITAVEGYTNRAASALSSSVWASADSTTNYASRITFNATSNSFNSRISNVATGAVYTTNLSAIAGSGLGITSNRLVVTNIPVNFPNNFISATGTIGAGASAHLTLSPSTTGTGGGTVRITNGAFRVETIEGPLDVNNSTLLVRGFDINAESGAGNAGNVLIRPGTNSSGFGSLVITQATVHGTSYGNFIGNASGLTNIQVSAIPNLSGTYLLLSTYLNDTNRLQIQGGSVTQGQTGTFGTSYISTTNYWISLGSTNWVKFEGKLNSF